MPTLDFKGKPFVYSHHLSVPFRGLEIDAKKSMPGSDGPSLDDNLIIHGDNLEALKALLPRYAGTVDLIYIDPPYNTGNEGWIYNDAVKSPLIAEWLGKTVDSEDLERHDKWLCMMWPRITLLKELLADDGIIAVSIDKTEAGNLRCMMDEIFGAGNYLATLSRRTKAGGGSAAAHFAIENDFVEIFAKNKDSVSPIFTEHSDQYLKRYKHEDDLGKYFWDTMERSSTKTKPYKIKAPDGKMLTGKWFRAEKRFLSDLKMGEVKFLEKDDGEWSVQFKQRLPKGKKIRTLLSDNLYKSSQDELESLGLKHCFENPKPTSLIELLCAMVGSNSTILDSYAGSGTTGHGVIKANNADGGERKFILIQLPEKVRNDTIAFKNGFKNIYELTVERITRVIKGYKDKKNAISTIGLDSTFTACSLGKPIELDSFFSGDGDMPSYEQIASYIAYTATGEALSKPPSKARKDWFIGEINGTRLHLIYKDDVDFMKSGSAALTEDLAKTIAKSNTSGKTAYVFGAVKYLSQKELSSASYRIQFCQLPYSIYRIMGDAPGTE